MGISGNMEPMDKEKRLDNAEILSFLHRIKLTPAERHVAVAILSFRNEKDMKCYPSHAKLLLFEPSLNESKLRTILQALRKKKIVVGVPVPGKPGEHKSNWYWFYRDLMEAEEIYSSWKDGLYKVLVKSLAETAMAMFKDMAFSLRPKRRQPCRIAAEIQH